MKLLDLEGKWALSQASHRGAVPCVVPGNIQSALVAAGIAEDPLLRSSVVAQSATDMDCEYKLKRSFIVAEDFLRHDVVDLELDCVDTLCDVSINGKLVLRADNMFRKWRVGVKSVLKAGSNSIAFSFSKATLENAPHKARSTFGLGWGGPDVYTCGIPGGVRLRAWSCARVAEFGCTQRHVPDGSVRLYFGGWVEQTESADRDLTLEIMIIAPDERSIICKGSTTVAADGDGAFNTIAQIKNPRLWWPSGMGAQPIYFATARLFSDDHTLLDEKIVPMGLRTLEVEFESGGIARVVCNGQPVVLKGAVWTRPHPYEVPDVLDYSELLLLAKFGGLNAFVLDNDAPPPLAPFWELCDRFGFIVLNSAHLGTEAEPDDDPDGDVEPDTATYLGHPCVIDTPLREPDADSGLVISRSFVSFDSPESMLASFGDNGLRLNSASVSERVALRGGAPALLSRLLNRWPIPKSPQDWVILSQLEQASEIKARITRLRLDGKASGLVWSPFISEVAGANASSIDALRIPKALHYIAARAWKNITVAAVEGSGGIQNIAVFNDAPDAFEGVVECLLTDIGGRVIACEKKVVKVQGRSSLLLEAPSEWRQEPRYALNELVLWLILRDITGAEIASDKIIFVLEKDIDLGQKDIDLNVEETEEGDGRKKFILLLSSQTAVFYVRLYDSLASSDWIFEDNFFDLRPDAIKRISVVTGRPIRLSAFKRRLKIASPL